MTHDRFGRSTQCTNGTLTQRVSSTGAPQQDGVLRNVVIKKISHYRQLYEDQTDPVIFLTVTMNTSGRVYDDFVCLIFWYAHRESSILVREFPRNLISFAFFELHVWRISRVL